MVTQSRPRSDWGNTATRSDVELAERSLRLEVSTLRSEVDRLQSQVRMLVAAEQRREHDAFVARLNRSYALATVMIAGYAVVVAAVLLLLFSTS